MKAWKFAVICSFGIFSACMDKSSTGVENGISKTEEAFIDKLFEAFSDDNPGAAVMIAKLDKVVFCKGYGLANIEENTPVDCDTHFRIGSVSKHFTAMGVLKLVDRGDLKLETKLVEIFPDFPKYGEAITLQHLLTHQSGLQDYGPMANTATGEQLSDADVLDYLMTLENLDFQSGASFQYSNTAYALLAEIIAKVSGQTFEDFMAKEIFVPAGMKTAQYYAKDANIPNRAYGYAFADKEIVLHDQSSSSAIKGDGSIYLSANELFNWHKSLSARSLMSPSLYDAAFSPQLGTSGRYGYGWFISQNKAEQYIEHDGSTAGFISYVAHMPKNNITVSILANRNLVWPIKPEEDFRNRSRALLSMASEGKISMPEEFVEGN